MGSPYLHGLHAQHAMLGPYIQYNVWGPLIYMGSMQVMLFWGPIVWGPHIYMLSHGHGSHIMLNWNSVMWGPHIYSTWVSHTVCYAGAYILSIVWGPHIYMPSVKVSTMYLLPQT